MGWFSNFFGGNDKKEPSSSSGSSNSSSSNNNNYNSYLEASGTGNQIANDQINTLIANKDNLQNQAGTVNVNPKFNDFIKRNTVNGVPNSAAQAIINQYDTGTNAYQQEMQKIIKSNPSAAQAYKKRFPITSGIQNLAGAASNLIPGVGMAKSILGVLNKMGGGAQTGLNKVKEGITNSDAYNDFIKMITIDEKPATDMGTRMSSMDQADADAASLNMADISGPSVATNIVDIKNNKVNTMPKNINAQSSLNDYFNTTGTINQIADSAGGVNTLPYNFTNTFNNLNPNALTSSQYLQGQNMINNLPENNTPIIPYSNVGINNPALFNKGSF